MNTFIPSQHPFSTIKQLMQIEDEETILRFSIYKYRPQQLEDDRRIFIIKSGGLTEDWIQDTLEGLETDEELALHSLVTIAGNDFHIPMIDFAGITPNHIAGLASVFGEDIADSFHFFKSGRSFHAYGCNYLIQQSKWVEFMGKLLLCNLNKGPMVVDQRWIGHRLIAGYSALRWSCNSKRHSTYPKLVEDMERISKLKKREKVLKLDSRFR